MQVFLVGGAVRDTLLGLTPSERDWVVVGANSEQMLKKGYTRVGKDFPVFLHPESYEEYALARTERKTGPGHTGFTVDAQSTITLEEDLLRRDLTINAMAQDQTGTLIDPHGGQADLEARVLRHVSAAFSEDPLRVFRVARFFARFSTFSFTIADETARLLQEMAAAGDLAQISAERVWQELRKCLCNKNAEIFFHVLIDSHAMEDWFSEIRAIDLSALGKVWQVIDETGCDDKEDTTVESGEPLDWQKFVSLAWFLPAAQMGEFSDRLKVPKIYKQCALQIAEFGQNLSVWKTLSDKDLYKALMKMGALKQSSRISSVLKVISLCARVDLSPVSELAQGLRGIKIADITGIEKLSGVHLGRALESARLAYIHSQR